MIHAINVMRMLIGMAYPMNGLRRSMCFKAYDPEVVSLSGYVTAFHIAMVDIMATFDTPCKIYT